MNRKRLRLYEIEVQAERLELGERMVEPEWYAQIGAEHLKNRRSPRVEAVSALRPARIFWNSFAQALLERGWMPEEIEVLVTSSSVRHGIDGIEQMIEAAARKMARSMSEADRDMVSSWVETEVDEATPEFRKRRNRSDGQRRRRRREGLKRRGKKVW